MVPDVNVLVAAFRRGHEHHRLARSWLDEAIRRCAVGETVEVLPMVAAGFLRIVTHPKIFADPDSIDEALAFIESLLAIPGVSMPALSGEWNVFRAMCRSATLRGNEIPDAWIAAFVRANGGHLVTFDRALARRLDRHELTVLASRA